MENLSLWQKFSSFIVWEFYVRKTKSKLGNAFLFLKLRIFCPETLLFCLPICNNVFKTLEEKNIFKLNIF